ncbi:MAG TPA: hypothetical protein VF669_21300, partial [Tepidisphaeraceae bacterium]
MRWIALLFLCATFGCNHHLAERLVEAQNFRSPMRGKDAEARVLTDHLVTRQLRIRVGPPRATYNVWVVDPVSGHGLLTLKATPGGYTFIRLSTTEPATQSSTRPSTRASTRTSTRRVTTRSTSRPASQLATLSTTAPTTRAT